MGKRINKFIYWTPRILSIMFVCFLALFSLDIFSEYNGWSVILPLFMHLIPSFFLLTVAIISWKYDLVGAIVFLGSAIFYIFMIGFNRPWSWYAFISGPTAIIGILFFIDWRLKKGQLGE